MDNTIGINGIIKLKTSMQPKNQKNILKVYTSSQTLTKEKSKTEISELAKQSNMYTCTCNYVCMKVYTASQTLTKEKKQNRGFGVSQTV
jgi:hypothetical protein